MICDFVILILLCKQPVYQTIHFRSLQHPSRSLYLSRSPNWWRWWAK
jgi:hypothetical protein